MIHFVVPEPQAFSIREYLAVWGAAVAPRMEVVPYGSLASLTSLARGTWVFAAIDQLRDGMRDLTIEARRQLGDAGMRVLNDPERTLIRFALLQALHARGLNDFRVHRVDEAPSDLRYPVFLRDERSHGGPLSALITSPDELRREVGRAVLRGRRLRDLMVVEYCDTADGAGFYRKFSAFVVGTAVIPRSVAYGQRWMLKHHGTEYSRTMVEEERDYVLANPHERELAEIFALAGAEYGRIDYAVKDGRIRTWEINLNPTIGRGTRPPSGRIPTELESVRRESKDHFYGRFQEAWELVDDPGESRDPVPFTASAALRRRARVDSAPPHPRFEGIRAALRPLGPLLRPVAARLFPEIGRMARRNGWKDS
jgi:hypothetical protein